MSRTLHHWGGQAVALVVGKDEAILKLNTWLEEAQGVDYLLQALHATAQDRSADRESAMAYLDWAEALHGWRPRPPLLPPPPASLPLSSQLPSRINPS